MEEEEDRFKNETGRTWQKINKDSESLDFDSFQGTLFCFLKMTSRQLKPLRFAYSHKCRAHTEHTLVTPTQHLHLSTSVSFTGAKRKTHRYAMTKAAQTETPPPLGDLGPAHSLSARHSLLDCKEDQIKQKEKHLCPHSPWKEGHRFFKKNQIKQEIQDGVKAATSLYKKKSWDSMRKQYTALLLQSTVGKISDLTTS